MAHSAGAANSRDPFGAHPMAMPYLFFLWGREGHFQSVDLLEIDTKENMDLKAWIFVLVRWNAP